MVGRVVGFGLFLCASAAALGHLGGVISFEASVVLLLQVGVYCLVFLVVDDD